MSQEEHPRRSIATHVTIWTLGALALLIVYVGSIGPVAWLARHGNIGFDNQYVETFYKPLSWVYKQSAKGSIPVLRCGNYLRFDWSAVSE